jgi:hypothetical protein
MAIIATSAQRQTKFASGGYQTHTHKLRGASKRRKENGLWTSHSAFATRKIVGIGLLESGGAHNSAKMAHQKPVDYSVMNTPTYQTE